MRECGFLCSHPALYKGARWGLGRPAQRIKAREEQGVEANPLPLLATAQFPTSTVRDPKCMGAAWRGWRNKTTDEAASLRLVIAGSGRPKNYAPAPSSKCTTPPHLPPFKEEGVNRPHHHGLTHARGA